MEKDRENKYENPIASEDENLETVKEENADSVAASDGIATEEQAGKVTEVGDMAIQNEEKGNPEDNIPEDEIWTYRVEGLPAPHINKPIHKATAKKIIFIAIILVAIAASIYFSVKAVSKEVFEYTSLSDGSYELKEFRNSGYIVDLRLDYVTDVEYHKEIDDYDSNFSLVENKDKPLTSIREYAFNCDEYLKTITVGKNVTSIDGKSFYTCSKLQNIFVDDDNPNYSDVDGVLYNKARTELICYPMAHDEYLARKHFGIESVPSDDEEGYAAYTDLLASEDYKKKVLTYVVPSTVTKIGELAFNYAKLSVVYLPEGLKSVETLGFFRATMLSDIYSYKSDTEVSDTGFTTAEALGRVYVSLPEGLEFIGSDAFSYDQALHYMYIPSSVKKIGHHAFWDCVYKSDGELKGLAEINVALDESSFEKNCTVGDQWKPKYDFMLFQRNVDINYSAVRQ